MSLAAGDPNALCTSGRQLRFEERWSWIHNPEDPESIVEGSPFDNPPMQSPWIKLDPDLDSRWISLDLGLLLPGGTADDTMRYIAHKPGETLDAVWIRSMKQAEMVIDACGELEQARGTSIFPFAINEWNYPMAGASHVRSPQEAQHQSSFLTGNFRTIMILGLHSCLLLGSSWVAKAFVPFLDPTLDGVILKRDFLFLETKLHTDLKAIIKKITMPKGLSAVRTVMKFLMYLIKAGNPQPFVIMDKSDSINAYVDFIRRRFPLPFITPSGLKGMVFTLYHPDDDAYVKIAIPTALRFDHYRNLCRVWLVGKYRENGVDYWRLLGKTRLIGDVAEMCWNSEVWKTLPSQWPDGR